MATPTVLASVVAAAVIAIGPPAASKASSVSTPELRDSDPPVIQIHDGLIRAMVRKIVSHGESLPPDSHAWPPGEHLLFRRFLQDHDGNERVR